MARDRGAIVLDNVTYKPKGKGQEHYAMAVKEQAYRRQDGTPRAFDVWSKTDPPAIIPKPESTGDATAETTPREAPHVIGARAVQRHTRIAKLMADRDEAVCKLNQDIDAEQNALRADVSGLVIQGVTTFRFGDKQYDTNPKAGTLTEAQIVDFSTPPATK
jgi:hypothetical protein